MVFHTMVHKIKVHCFIKLKWEVESLSRTRAITNNDLQLKEVGGFYRDAFAEKDFSLTTNLSAEHNAANFF